MNLRLRTSAEGVLRALGLHQGCSVSAAAAAAKTFTVLLTIPPPLFTDGVFSAAINQAVTFSPLPAY